MAQTQVIVGIAGGSGSGKTTFARQLQHQLGPDFCRIMRHDDYYRDLATIPVEERERVDFDRPDQLETELLVAHLDLLRDGCAVEIPVYDFASHTRRPETRRLEPAPIILVEGVLVLAEPRLCQGFDLKIFLEAPESSRIDRRLRRDVVERGRSEDSVLRQLEVTVLPAHRTWVAPSRQQADLILDTSQPRERAVEFIARGLKSWAGERSGSPGWVP